MNEGLSQLLGIGHARDAEKGLALLRQGASAGRPKGLIDYAAALYLQQKHEDAVRVAKRVAKMGRPEGHLILAMAHHGGCGTARSMRRMAYHYRKASELGDVDAMLRLAGCYERGDGVRPSRSKAISLLQRASDGGLPRATYELARLLLEDSKSDTPSDMILKLFYAAAEAGSPHAQEWAGEYLMLKRPRIDDDVKTAIRFLHSSAEQGHPGALLIVALMYYRGDGVPKNADLAFQAALAAARAGNADAQRAAAIMIMSDDSLVSSGVDATTWLSLASGQGDYQAKLVSMMLGEEKVPARKRCQEPFDDALSMSEEKV